MVLRTSRVERVRKGLARAAHQNKQNTFVFRLCPSRRFVTQRLGASTGVLVDSGGDNLVFFPRRCLARDASKAERLP